ncbi:SCP2 domain-containing protein [Motiliproteus sp. MSK22-1]|uniref:ubiquinone biosynthesis accessory factor UbiJ n=1 Tax=Motiliproteus sp. MSK22-1 TaxID=1897630 RepID=UPI000977A545|nr:SCP2 sterol-binding domain-containing protein [Motiliproteus sp. MSK22-1]OMH39547.1 hypothetical protein BGP75_02865 [Motiliproteus sp. MSK22-1]
MLDLFNDGLKTVLEVAIKVAFKRDPATLRRLARLDGKVIEVRLTAPEYRLFVLPVTDGIEFDNQHILEGHCVIEGAASDFLEILLDEQKTFGSGIRLSGDTQLAIELKSCLQKLDIDWEDLLAEAIGDLAAHQFAAFFRKGRAYAKQSTESLLDDLDDYLHEEVRLLPPRIELEHFYDQVDQLRLTVDRLEARIDLLEKSPD